MCSYCSRFITTPTGIPTYRPLEKVHLLCCGLSADPNKSIHAGRPPTIDAARAVSCVPTNANKHFWPFLFGYDAFRSRLASLWVGWDEWVAHHSTYLYTYLHKKCHNCTRWEFIQTGYCLLSTITRNRFDIQLLHGSNHLNLI